LIDIFRSKENIAFGIVYAFLLCMLCYSIYNFFQTGVIKNIIFSLFLLSLFLSWHLKSKYTGEKQKLFRNILYMFLLVFVCIVIFLSKLGLDFPGFLLISYFAGLFLYMIIMPPFLEKYSTKNRFIILLVPGAIVFLIFFFSPFFL